MLKCMRSTLTGPAPRNASKGPKALKPKTRSKAGSRCGQRQSSLLASLTHRFVDAVVCLESLSASERKQLQRPFFAAQ